MTNVTESTFHSEVLKDHGVVLVDFWAPWCGPCRMVGPVLEEISREKGGKIKVVKVNVDDNPQLAANYKIMSIPTMLVFKNGQAVEGFVGAKPKAAIDKILDKWID